MDVALFSDLFTFIRTPLTCLMLAYARWFVFASMFAPFAWAKINTGMIRSGISFIFAVPLATHLFHTQGAEIQEFSMGFLIGLACKEAIIGFMLGILASLPIWVADVCGGVLAGIRQEEAGEDQFGSSSFGNTFVLIAIGILIYDGGFLHVLSAVYDSYAVWPATAPMPLFSINAAAAFLSLLDITFELALSIAAPFIITWLLIDIWLGIMARSAGKIDTGSNTDMIKAMVTIALLFFLLQPITTSLTNATHDMADLIGMFYQFIEGE